MPHHPTFLITLLCLLAAAARAAEPAAVAPSARVSLFNGTDLSAFTTWLAVHGTADPDRVFSVVDRIDGAPAIRISGQHYGGILTRGQIGRAHV